MAFNNCMRMVPFVGRRLAAATPNQLQPVRTIFSPWPRPTDIGALIRDMDRQMDRLERQMFRSIPSWVPRISALPIDHTVDSSDGQYRLSVDMSGFKPEEVNLALDDSGRRLTISAKCERKGRDGSRYAHEMSRTITLPETIDVEKLSSMLHTDGVLAIEAPYKDQPQVESSHEPKRIPISRTGGAAEAPQLENKEQSSS